MSEKETPTTNIKVDDEENEINIADEDTHANEENKTNLTAAPANTNTLQRSKLPFKNPKFSYIEEGGKKFVWKSLKQITTQERSLHWQDDAVTYASLNAPPSFKPAKKYSDISGLIAPYADPQTKLYYHNAEEFRIIRSLPSDIVQGYLALRGATNIVG